MMTLSHQPGVCTDVFDRIQDLNPRLASELRRWGRELMQEDFRERIFDTMEGLRDRRDWCGREGDEASEQYEALKHLLESCHQEC